MLALWLTVLTGCQNHGPLYQASALPAQFTAVPPANPRMFNLARLAQSTSRSQFLYPGDVLEVSIATGLEEDKAPTWLLRISDSGELTVPLVGNVLVEGLQLVDCERVIRTAAIERGQFVSPNVSVVLKDRKKNMVSVVGAVNDPGEVRLPIGQSDLFNAIMEAGGLSDDAATVVEVRHPMTGGAVANGANGPSAELAGFRRGGPAPSSARQLRYDLREITGGATGDFHVEDGTTITVSRNQKQYIQVMGLVRKSDQFEMAPGREIRMLDALAMANGRTLEFADKVRVIRRLPTQTEPVVIEASVRKAKRDGAENLLLSPGDVVSVEETPLTFVVGTIREFVRFGFTSAIPGI